ncbi:DUF6279 family lipoprotein [Marinobacter sp.]|uniref:DUF6279 family lipoprotein n=1 Tax=Marinobacter sp. TaxID=50741 RepID=UPI003569BD32
MQAFMPVRVVRTTCILLVVVVLGACSSTRLAYRFADQGVLWWVDDYVTLTREQKATLRNDLEVLKAWHCEAELPRYSGWLGKLREEMANGELPPARIEFHREQVATFAEPLAARIVPVATSLLGTLSDAQVEELEVNMAREQEDRKQEFLGDDSQQKSAERIRERTERWLGTLNQRQQTIIDDWTRDRQQQTRIWLQGRGHWQQALSELLGERRQADFGPRLRDLILNAPDYQGEAYRNMLEANTRDLTRLTHDLLQAADDRHWRTLQKSIASLEQDVSALACALPDTDEPRPRG